MESVSYKPPPTHKPPLPSRVFFGMTHQIDNLIDWVKDVLFHLRHGKKAERIYKLPATSKPEALRDVQELLTKNNLQNFDGDIPRCHELKIGSRSWQQKDIKVADVSSALTDLVGEAEALALKHLLHQGLPAKTTTDICLSCSRMPVRAKWTFSIQKIKSSIEVSYTQHLDLKDPAKPTYSLKETRTLLIPASELDKGIPNATSQLTYSFTEWRPFKYIPPVQDQAFVTRTFDTIFSYTLYPLVQKVSSCVNRA